MSGYYRPGALLRVLNVLTHLSAITTLLSPPLHPLENEVQNNSHSPAVSREQRAGGGPAIWPQSLRSSLFPTQHDSPARSGASYQPAAPFTPWLRWFGGGGSGDTLLSHTEVRLKSHHQQAPTRLFVHSSNQQGKQGRAFAGQHPRLASRPGAWTGHGPAHAPCRAQPHAGSPARSGSSRLTLMPHRPSSGTHGRVSVRVCNRKGHS